MTDATAPRGDINKIELHDEQEFGWGHSVCFGTDMDRGWCLECDMENGSLLSAFTPAGQDPMFLMQAHPMGKGKFHGTTVRIQIEGAEATWDPVKRELVIVAGEETDDA